jgi:hypothetical protein
MLIRQPTLRTFSFAIAPNTHWKVKGDPYRRVFSMEATTPLGGFDIAFTHIGTLPEDDEWVDGWGKEGTGNNITTKMTIETGIASDIHVRDSNNTGVETLVMISDIKPVMEQIL